MGLDVVIAPYSTPIAHKDKIMDKTNWINFILILLFYFKALVFEITNYGIFVYLI